MRARSPYRRLIFAPLILVAASVLCFPLLVRAKDQAQHLKCAWQLKEIGRAIELYRGDYDGAYPYGVDPSDRGVPSMWDAQPEFKKQVAKMPLVSEALARYVPKPETFRCPLDNGSEILDNDPYKEFRSAPSMYAKYGMSYFYRTDLGLRSIRVKGYQASERANVLFDACGHWHGNVRAIRIDEPPESFSELGGQYLYNVLMGDGRVERVGYNGLRRMWRVRQ